MSAQIDLFWVFMATILLTTTALVFALYIVYRNNKEIAAKRRELQILNEKHGVESQLQKASRMVTIGALAGGMAYYLHSILFSIRSLMEMMKHDQKIKKSVTQLSSLAADEIARGLRITEHLQQIAHPQKLALLPLSATELVNSTLENLKCQFHNSIKIKTNFTQNKNIVLGDRTLLRQVLVNLLNNAADAMPDGGVIIISVSTTSESGEIGAEVVNDKERNLVISVSDCGAGMDEETKRQVFDPFFTTKMRPDRLGLGLSFAYGIVKIHNGCIIVESEKDRGTTVALYIPEPSQDQIEHYEKQEVDEEDLTLDLVSLEERMALLQREVGRA